MEIKRIVPDLACADVQSVAAFYRDVLGLDVVMDLGWVVTLAADPRQDHTPQVTLMARDETADRTPDLSVEVDDVDEAHRRVVEAGAPIVHPLTDEAWGVRRFFTCDPSGRVVNILSHRGP